MLAAWAASPARFREDANAEEDLALGGYRDRVVVELAQNAADAAGRSGEPGRLRLSLTPDELLASNTGAPLDRAGVESLSTLRASAKRGDDGSVGRFGVGFAAVLAVSDAPVVRSTGGAVAWSRASAYELAAAVPGLADEVAARHGQVPLLRLPLATEGDPEHGFATTVTLPLRDPAAYDLAHRLLTEVDASLLLSLPGLGEVEVRLPEGARRLTARGADGTVSIDDDGLVTTWRLLGRSGRHADGDLADRPVEERARPWWQVSWAVPVADGRVVALPDSVPRLVHAPTPTDEPLDLPALLVASFPLDPTRRHLAPGAARDALVDHAAQLYADLAAALGADGLDAQPLVPGPLAAGPLDAELRRAVRGRLSVTPFLLAVDGKPVSPREATVLDPGPRALVSALEGVLDGLVPTTDPRRLETLGARRLEVADVVDTVAGLEREPGWWRTLYDALDPLAVDPAAREAMGALPVPLADGRLVTGPRGLLTGLGAVGLEPLGLRVVHSLAAHPLLVRLGAMEASPAALLADPAVEAAVAALAGEASAPDPDEVDQPERVVGAVLGLVAEVRPAPGELPWLGQLPLAAEDGELEEADRLVLPGSPAAEVYDLLPVHADVVTRWGTDVLAAVGVRSELSLTIWHDVPLDGTLEPLDGASYDDLLRRRLPDGTRSPVLLTEVPGLDLSFIRDESWLRVLELAAREPVRRAVTTPARVPVGAGHVVELTSYAAWQLRQEVRLDGRRLDELRLPGDARLDGLYDAWPALTGLDQAFLAAVGVRTSLDALLAEAGGADDLLARLAEPAREVGAAQLALLYAALAAVPADEVEPPDRVRVAPGLVVDAADVVVADGPYLLALAWPVPPLVVPHELAEPLADLLDVDLASERVGGPAGAGSPRDVPPEVGAVLATAPTTWREHDELVVDGHEVDWWVAGDGPDAVVHAATVDGLARGLAWAGGGWSRRLLVAAVLAEPERLDALLAEAAFDVVGG